jgi:phage terminase large subunit GpA-like protein
MSNSNSSNSATPQPTSPLALNEERLRRARHRGWTPPPRISIPEWADRFRKHKDGTNWRTSEVEVARGPMLAPTEPGVHIVTAMVATQLLKTSLIENITGHKAHLDPCDMLLVQPKEDAAEQFSKERIAPFIAATPVLRVLIGTTKTRKSEETLLYKSFPGGFLALVGAGSPDNLARRPVRIVMYDEVDKYPVTREGDPIDIGDERTAKFSNWLSVRACSPTVKDESRIEASYLESDQRRASVACPHCGHRQFPDFFKHVEWEKSENGHRHRTETARLYCEACGAGWSEGQRRKALQTIRWHQTRPFECCVSSKHHWKHTIWLGAWSMKARSTRSGTGGAATFTRSTGRSAGFAVIGLSRMSMPAFAGKLFSPGRRTVRRTLQGNGSQPTATKTRSRSGTIPRTPRRIASMPGGKSF